MQRRACYTRRRAETSLVADTKAREAEPVSKNKDESPSDDDGEERDEPGPDQERVELPELGLSGVVLELLRQSRNFQKNRFKGILS